MKYFRVNKCSRKVFNDVDVFSENKLKNELCSHTPRITRSS